MLFLLCRKSDGRYWNNSGARAGDAWTDDIQACTPFRTKNSARMARCFGYVPSRTAWGGQYAAMRDRKDREFEKGYEIVPVKLIIQLVENN